jgi:ribosomal protein S12 methylthiotransferase accessory factor YcaO
MIANAEQAGLWSELRRRLEEDALRLLAGLSERQHLKPHTSLKAALNELAVSRGMPERSLTSAADRAGFDADTTIGRLRKVDLIRIARFAAREMASC